MKKLIFFYILLIFIPLLMQGQCESHPYFPGISYSNPIIVSDLSSPFIDTKNNSIDKCFGNDNITNSSDDIWYQFTLNVESVVYISHCGSAIDTYMTLYDSRFTGLQVENDNSDLFCTGTTAAGIKITLPAGSYFLVSEGKGSASGDIITTISLTPIVVQVPVEDPLETASDVPYTAKNYITTYSPRQAYTGTEAMDSKTPAQVMKKRQYYDGLGRLMQTVGVRASPELRDVVQPTLYNSYGRETIKSLPYVATALQSDGAYKVLPVKDVKSFYGNPTGIEWNTPGIPSTNSPFSQSVNEFSPLGRLLKQGASGEDWQIGAGHELQKGYGINAAQEVLKFSIDASGLLTVPTYWEKGAIWVDSNSNEEHLKTKTFNDKQYSERIYVKRVENKDVMEETGQSASYWMDTYYVYNQKGELSYVLPPEFIKQYVGYSGQQYASLPISAPSQNLLNQFAFQYKYDDKGRVVAKRLPGKEWELIVYNQNNLPVLTQDANLRRTDQWLFIKYDIYGRNIATGICTIAAQNLTGANIWEKRDALQIIADQYNLSHKKYESLLTTASVIPGYTNNSYPTDNLTVYTLNYFDDYQFLSSESLTLPISTSFGEEITRTVRALGTGSKIRVLGTNQWILNVQGYNPKGQVIWSRKSNPYLSTTNTVEKIYNFTGEVVQTKTIHSKSGNSDIEILDKFDYDHQGRMIKQIQCLGGNCSNQQIQGIDLEYNAEITQTSTIVASSSITLKPGFHFKSTTASTFSASIANQGQLIAFNQYNELGQLISKKVGNILDKPLQSISYSYNIRGWLTAINNPESLGNSLFGLKLGYNTLVSGSINSDPLFNGNISGILSANANDNIQRSYGFRYDGANRLKKADYDDNDAGTNQNFDEGINSFIPQGIEYDFNGNILKLSRYGLITTSTFGLMDQLTYSYDGNRLMRTEDPVTLASTVNDQEFKNLNSSGDDYGYDDNGNMTKDQNKSISEITYNHMNLPVKITFSTGTITYDYDATGVKLRKTVSTGTTTDYADGFQYENNMLKFFPHTEGYVECNSGKFNYIYQYKDHLGNVRLSYIDSNNDGKIVASEILEASNYYPFGLKQKNSNNVVSSTNPAQKYKYNGKELQDENIGGQQLNWYDYGARNYDPALGRWMNMDPLAEKFPSWSPYNYTMNNPINMVDPDGRAPDWHKDANNKNILVKDKGDNATTLREYVNKNNKDANLTQSASETLYSSMKDNKVNIDKLNPETLNKNLFGLNYPGSNNPKKYNGESDYSVKPTEIEIPAYRHDKDYDYLRAAGGGDLFTNSATSTADDNFVKRMDKLVDKYQNAGEYKLMVRASILGNGLSAASSFKKSWQEIKQSVIIPTSLTNPIYLHP